MFNANTSPNRRAGFCAVEIRMAEQWYAPTRRIRNLEAFMTDLDARKTIRTNAWMNLIVGAFLIVLETAVRPYLGLLPVWSDPDLGSRVAESVILVCAVVMVVMGCRQLFRSKTS